MSIPRAKATPTGPWSRRARAAAACLFALIPTAGYSAAVAFASDISGDQMSVRELMRLETKLAIEQAKDRVKKLGSSQGDSIDALGLAQGSTLQLMAIYGVGKKLLAEVSIGGRPHVYMHGSALAVGAKADPSAFVLRGISGSCVQLERKDEAHTLCLPPSLWTNKP